MKVYLDNAATTPLGPEARAAMSEAMEVFGNPSSIHAFGRHARSLIEQARKDIAAALHCSAGELIFTGSGSEGNNTVLELAVRDLGVKRIITSPTEHHAVLYPALSLQERGTEVAFLQVSERGEPNLDQLKELLTDPKPTLVSLMHGNNEIGNLINLKEVAQLCKEHKAWFHSDTVQTVGHFPINLQEVPVDFITASAHKFHGPKGAGFLFVRKGTGIKTFIHGGGQERGHRAGTENTIGIAGLAAALNAAVTGMEEDRQHILELKNYFIRELTRLVPEVSFNGLSGDPERSLYTVVNVLFPAGKSSMLLFELDLKGVAASGGSACSSGANKGSHVLEALGFTNPDRPYVRFSFSKFTQIGEVDYALQAIAEVMNR